ncbi:hypothetical protein [Frigidibacter sp. ROC022]|uniref:hypothetical protein n=1 Tax=Frigidibacter sp. ROC022 TaxID=2971796 RepID=UPI00215A9CE0|nr:hypothetical protein [Frigidibacter sp. ROC022]MCR8723784.1 hypothetical protein [Frigidibacter sp. ROC022]
MAEAMTAEVADRTGLIREAYRIEGITEAECRSIFLDWAMKLAPEVDNAAAIRFLLDLHAPGDRMQDHPMTAVLRAALETPARTGRRGGWRGRAR